MTTTASPPGWHPDPSGRQQLRYWDGYRWTDQIMDAGVARSETGAPDPSPPAKRPSRWKARVVGVLAIAVPLVLLRACAYLVNQPEPEVRDPDTGAVREPAFLAVTELRVGDCLVPRAVPSADEADAVTTVRLVRVVPCEDQHQNEVFGRTTVPADVRTWPGDDAMLGLAAEACSSNFRDYVGIDMAETELAVGAFFPQRSGFAQGDRGVVCYVSDGGDRTGSLRDARR